MALKNRLFSSVQPGSAFDRAYDPPYERGTIREVPGDDKAAQIGEVAAQPADGAISLRSLEEYKRMFDDYRAITESQRTTNLKHTDYYDGNQLTPDEKKTLADRGQPDIVVNRTRVAVNGILGVAEQSRTEPRAWPRTPGDEDSSDVATDALRYIADRNGFKRKKVEAFKDMLVPGCAALLVEVDEDKDVCFRPIRWEEFFYDPRSRFPDFRDARYLGIAKWMYADDLGDKYPDVKDDIDAASTVTSAGVIDESFQDRPLTGYNLSWSDPRARRLMVVEIYWRKGTTWYRCVYYSGGILEEAASAYKDDKGKSIHPIAAMSCYVDRNNNRMGVVTDMIDLQDEINKRRSKLLHILSTSQIQARDPSAIEVDADTARKEAARPDGVIPYGWQKVPTTDSSAGQLQLLAESKSEMERFGPNPAVLGRQGSDTSGRAILARQQAGLVELGLIFGQLDDWELRVYRLAWFCAKQYWTDPMWIRVTDDEDAPKFVHLNEPIPHPALAGPQGGPPNLQLIQGGLSQPPEGQPAPPPPGPMPGGSPPPGPQGPMNPLMAAAMQQGGPAQGQPGPDMGQPGQGQPPGMPQQPPQDPSEGLPPGVLGYKNNIASMDVDITIDTTPETANIQAEQFKDLAQLISSSPVYSQQVPLEVLVSVSPLPHKRRLVDQIKAYKQQQQQAQADAQAQAQAQEQAKHAADVHETEAKANLNDAKAAHVQRQGVHLAVGAHLKAIDSLMGAATAAHNIAKPDPAAEGQSGASGGSPL